MTDATGTTEIVDPPQRVSEQDARDFRQGMRDYVRTVRLIDPGYDETLMCGSIFVPYAVSFDDDAVRVPALMLSFAPILGSDREALMATIRVLADDVTVTGNSRIRVAGRDLVCPARFGDPSDPDRYEPVRWYDADNERLRTVGQVADAYREGRGWVVVEVDFYVGSIVTARQ